MKYCIRCGTANTDTAKFCVECGALMDSPGHTESEQPEIPRARTGYQGGGGQNGGTRTAAIRTAALPEGVRAVFRAAAPECRTLSRGRGRK